MFFCGMGETGFDIDVYSWAKKNIEGVKGVVVEKLSSKQCEKDENYYTSYKEFLSDVGESLSDIEVIRGLGYKHLDSFSLEDENGFAKFVVSVAQQGSTCKLEAIKPYKFAVILTVGDFSTVIMALNSKDVFKLLKENMPVIQSAAYIKNNQGV